MIFKSFPDPADTGARRNYFREDQTMVVHDVSEQTAYSRHLAPLSVKAVMRGCEYYNVHGFEAPVRRGDILVINAAQPYESRVDRSEPVESICVFFTLGDLRLARQGLVELASALDDPAQTAAPLEFAAVRRKAPADLQAMLERLPSLRSATQLERQEISVRLLMSLHNIERGELGDAGCLDAVRPAARAELYRRCLVAKSLIEAECCEDMALSDISHAASLSRVHLIRAFNDFFGETPSRMLRRLRMEHAATLLRQRRWTIGDIGHTVGYANFSAFTRAFRQHFGVSPRRFLEQLR